MIDRMFFLASTKGLLVRGYAYEPVIRVNPPSEMFLRDNGFLIFVVNLNSTYT